MRSFRAHLVARSIALVLAGCASPPAEPDDGANGDAADAAADAPFDRAAPTILNGGFTVPRSDAAVDGPVAPADAPGLPEAGSDRDVAAPEASSGLHDARTTDVCGEGALRDAPIAAPTARDASAADADASAADADACAAETAPVASCGDGTLDPGEGCDDGNRDNFDACSNNCRVPTDHVIITEVVTRPSGAEMIEIHNPRVTPVDLSDYALSDSHLYYAIATGAFSTGSGSDFVAFFPVGSQLAPGAYLTVSIANASGGLVSFESTYGKKPDFELRPTANGARDDDTVPNMQPANGVASIGASASLTDAGEPVVLFRYDGSGGLVSDVDYVYYGAPSTANPAVDKTGIAVGGLVYGGEVAGSLQHPAAAPGDGGALHRCAYDEGGEVKPGGNGSTCHDETSEDFSATFTRSANAPDQRTPGGPPPAGLCP